MNTKTLSPELLYKMDAYGRAANYLSPARFFFTTNR
jgi:phosphoketolase